MKALAPALAEMSVSLSHSTALVLPPFLAGMVIIPVLLSISGERFHLASSCRVKMLFIPIQLLMACRPC